MPSSPPRLKDTASDLFAPELAAQVHAQIDQDAAAVGGLMPHPLGQGEVPSAQGLADWFLPDRFYDGLTPGQLTGRFAVRWDGMDSFVYIPDADQPLTYTTLQGRAIQPRIMYTDGGSIPRILRGMKKFSSWGYAPAFMIHDWLFAARKCDHAPDTDWTFPDSARVLAEVMKCLMENGFTNYAGQRNKLDKTPDTLYVIYLGVRSPIAENLWNNDKDVICLP